MRHVILLAIRVVRATKINKAVRQIAKINKIDLAWLRINQATHIDKAAQAILNEINNNK